jgi:hypothetical protein
MTKNRAPTKDEKAVAQDEAEIRSLITGEVLRERGLCPLVLVRTRDAGVHVGLMADRDINAETVTFLEGRRIWRWRGANTLHEVVTKGIAEQSCVSEPVRGYDVHAVAEVLPVSDAAAESLTRSRWKP